MVAHSLLTTITLCWGAVATAAEPLNLSDALLKAYSSNPEVAATQSRLEAEQATIRTASFLDDPHIGFMREANMNFMENQQGPMNSILISQAVKFPAKYFLLGNAQSARATQAEAVANQKRLEVRTKVITGYYALFSVEKVLDLFDAQRETLREIARTAEARYATGGVPQQDEMKAHVEQTELEKDILMTNEERMTARAMLSASLGQDGEAVSLPKGGLPLPNVTADLMSLLSTVEHHSKHIKEAQAMVEESNSLKSLATMSYAPDFLLSYRRGIGSYYDQNAYSAGIEITFPLWFFAKQSGEVASASARANEAEHKLEAVKLSHLAEARSLAAKVQSSGKILDIYQTGLIPQATSTMNSSRASYQAGKTSLIELLDSERSLYNVRIAYYRTLAQYAESIAKLEETLGESISSLPFGDQNHEH